MRSARHFYVLALLLAANALSLHGQESRPTVHPLFSDHMVLQRGKEIPVWGWAKPGSKVSVAFGDQVAHATAGEDGKWIAKLGALEANDKGTTLSITTDKEIEFNDVLVGDVWICSGQSNMEWPVTLSNDPQSEIANANHPQVRLFTVPKKISYQPQELVDGAWSVCSPKSIPGFSAVGYFFGRELNQKLKIPIGLIHTSWGGTIAEAWTSGEALVDDMDDFDDAVAALSKTAEELASGKYDYAKQVTEWWQENDAGSGTTSWSRTDTNDSGWKTMRLPQNWEDANVGMDDFDGIVWFRTTFELPNSWNGQDLVLNLGAIDDADTTWVNGHEVGGMALWNQKRKYRVPSEHVKAGRNVIAIRVFDNQGGGGIYDKSNGMTVELASDDSKSISIEGDWHYKVSAAKSDLKPFPQSMTGNPNQVTVLYNGMLAPLEPFGITGAIWYQGESNAGRATQYRTLLPTMIKDWRNRFGQGDFPFLVVQLANFMQQQSEPVQSGWAELREAQAMTAQRDEKVGLAVITDIGEANDIHPRNKQDVGKRLALQAMKIQYGQDVVDSGPTIGGMVILGDSLVVEFANVGSGLKVDGDELKGFAIAERDGDFVWAEAELKGKNSVILWSDELAEPIRVRYNWANNPIGNLFNEEGLPAASFRTDRR